MEQRHLTDESIAPNDELIFSIIGDKSLIWERMMSHLQDNYKGISPIWKYYKDGKCWMLRILKGKNTLCWILLLNNTFRIAFYFAERLEPLILDSDLSVELKEQYKQAKPFNKSRAIYIDVEEPGDLYQIKLLIDLKLKQ